MLVASCLPTLATGATAAAQLGVSLNVAIPTRSLTLSIQRPTGTPGSTVASEGGAVAVGLSPTTNCQLPVGTITPTTVGTGNSAAAPANRAPANTGNPEPTSSKPPVGGLRRPTAGTILTYTSQCDTAFDLAIAGPGCRAAAGQSATEGLNVLVATRSTDKSTSFTALTSWTVAS